MQLLVIDADAQQCDATVRALKSDGHAVTTCASLHDARLVIATRQPELIVLDLALPDGNAVELCRELRSMGSSLAVLVLTARAELQDRVESLDAGADDFLAKPYASAELCARVRALGRRRAHGYRSSVLVRANVSVDFGARRAKVGGQLVELTAREWIVLETLASEPGRAVRRDELLRQGWGDVSDQASASLEVLIGRIRRKLGSALIRTQRNHGYSFGRE